MNGKDPERRSFYMGGVTHTRGRVFSLRTEESSKGAT